MSDVPDDGKRTSKRRKVSSAMGTETPTLSVVSSKNQPEAEPFKNDAVTEQRDKGMLISVKWLEK